MDLSELEIKIKKYQNELISFIDINESIFKYDIYNLKKSLLEFNNFIVLGKYEVALSSLDENLSYFMLNFQMSKDDILEKKHIKLKNYYDTLYNILELKKEYYDSMFINYINRFRSLSFFTSEELDSDELDHDIQVYVERAINLKLFKNYKFIESDDILDPNDNILFYPMLGISEDIESWLNFLKKQNDFLNKNPNSIVATLFFQLDDIEPHYSSFLITLHKGDSIWISTDKLKFGNPHNKVAQAARGNSSGKIGRIKDEHYINIGLPYHLAFEMDQIRTNQIVKSNYYTKFDLSDKINDQVNLEDFVGNVLIDKGYKYTIKKDFKDQVIYKYNGKKIAVFQKLNKILTVYEKPEINVYDISKLLTIEKFYYVNLVERLLEDIYNNPPEMKLELIGDYMNKKMIGNEKINPMDVEFNHFTDIIKDEINEMFDGLNLKEIGLVKPTYDLAFTSNFYDANYLDTVSNLENNISWCILDQKRENIQLKLDEISNNQKSDFEKLKKLLISKKDEIYKWLFLGNNLYLEYMGSFSFNSSHKDIYIKKMIYLNNEPTMKYGTGSFHVGKKIYDKEICHDCNNYYSLHQYTVNITNYTDLMLLMNIKNKNELPLYFRNYKSHDNIQYRGNSLLDNTHPYSRLCDPASEYYRNGFYINFYMCNKCFKKYQKKYQKFNNAKICLDSTIEEFIIGNEK